MKSNTLALTVLLGLATPYASATTETDPSNTFQHEANLTFGTHTDGFDDGLWNIDYRYYFNPVDTESGP